MVMFSKQRERRRSLLSVNHHNGVAVWPSFPIVGIEPVPPLG